MSFARSKSPKKAPFNPRGFFLLKFAIESYMWILLKFFFSLLAFTYRLIDRQRIKLKDGEVRLVDGASISVAQL